MDAQRIAIARNCLDGAHDNTMTFPDIVGRLIEAGFEGYAVDYRRKTTTYFLPDGDSVALDNLVPDSPIAAAFDAAGVAAQVKWAQLNPPDYSYTAFCENVRTFGCAGYIVSFLGRRVVYYGRTAEIHTEHFPR